MVRTNAVKVGEDERIGVPPARKPVMTIDELLSNLQRDRANR